MATPYFDKLVREKAVHIAQKKAAFKKGDVISFLPSIYNSEFKEGGENKAAASADDITGDTIQVVSVINTTMIMDSHKDVHINGLWKKSISEKKSLYLLKEHDLSFEGIISDQVKARIETRTWKELGYDADGETQALVFYSTIKREDHPYMFDKYVSRKVKNHSVGMQYVSLALAINDKDYKEENAVWNKYIDKIINRKEVEENGYYWAVTEAKAVEGSAVPLGSNAVTPTLAVEEKHEQENTGAGKSTPTDEQKLNYLKLTENFSL